MNRKNQGLLGRGEGRISCLSGYLFFSSAPIPSLSSFLTNLLYSTSFSSLSTFIYLYHKDSSFLCQVCFLKDYDPHYLLLRGFAQDSTCNHYRYTHLHIHKHFLFTPYKFTLNNNTINTHMQINIRYSGEWNSSSYST